MSVVVPALPPLSHAARTATRQHEVNNTVIHSALRRDIARAGRSLAAGPDPRHRRALAAHLLWMLQQLHHHHTVEDDFIWPAVLAHRPDLADMVDQLEAEHGDLAEASHNLRDMATAWSYDGTDARRAAVSVALDRLSVVLEKHLEHEEAEAMPLICSVLTKNDWKAIEKEIHSGTGSAGDKARMGYWLLDSLDPRREKIFLAPIPKPVQWLLRAVYFPREQRRAQLLWG